MYRKLTTAEACFELCKGAFICVSHHTHFKRPVISLSNPKAHRIGPLGYITEKQFNEINTSFYIKFIGDKKNKYGSIYNYYDVEDFVLAAARKEYLKRKKEKKCNDT